MGWCGHACQAPVAGLQQFAEPPRSRFAPPDLDQRSDDIAYHVMEKRIGFTVNDKKMSVPLNLKKRDLAYRCL